MKKGIIILLCFYNEKFLTLTLSRWSAREVDFLKGVQDAMKSFQTG